MAKNILGDSSGKGVKIIFFEKYEFGFIRIVSHTKPKRFLLEENK